MGKMYTVLGHSTNPAYTKTTFHTPTHILKDKTPVRSFWAMGWQNNDRKKRNKKNNCCHVGRFFLSAEASIPLRSTLQAICRFMDSEAYSTNVCGIDVMQENAQRGRFFVENSTLRTTGAPGSSQPPCMHEAFS